MSDNLNIDANILWQEIFRIIKSIQNTVAVRTDFHGQMGQINDMFRNDQSALMITIINYMIATASVDFTFETDNTNLTKALDEWKRNLNKNINVDIPKGLAAFTKQYFRERWKSSFLALNIVWDKVDNFWLPSKMWLCDGASLYVDGDGGRLDSYKYYIGKKAAQKLELPLPGTDLIIRKPYSQWHDKYPSPYLVSKGALYHALVKREIVDKQGALIEAIIPYLLQLKAGSEALAKMGQNPTEQEVEQMKQQFRDLKENYRYQVRTKGAIAGLNYDVDLQHFIPDLKKAFDAEITLSTDKNILAAMGMIELQGFSKNREETILNPKVLIEEITNSVNDYADLLEEIIDRILEKNRIEHRKYSQNDVRVVPGVIKSILTSDMKQMLRSLFDRGTIGHQDFLETCSPLDFKISLARRRQEADNQIDTDLYPHVIQNQEDKGIDLPPKEEPIIPSPQLTEKKKKDDKKKLEKAEDVTPEGNRTNKTKEPKKKELVKEVPPAIEEEKRIPFDAPGADTFLEIRDNQMMGEEELEDGELIMAPYNSLSDLNDSVKKALPVAAQKIFMHAFNSSYNSDKDEKKAFRVAWGAVKNAGYHKNASGKWSK